MKKRIPTFLAGMLTMALVCGLSVSALAASGLIQLDVRPINVMVKGEQFKPKDANGEDVLVFTYQGTTYAPLRALAEAYGLEVGYDAATNMATVTGDVAAPGTPATEVPIPTPNTTTSETETSPMPKQTETPAPTTAPHQPSAFELRMDEYERHQGVVDELNSQYNSYRDTMEDRKRTLRLETTPYFGSQSGYDSEKNELISEIAALSNKAFMLSLDDSREAQARYSQSLEEQAKKQKKLNELQAAYAAKMQIEAFDQMLSNYKDEIQQRIQEENELYQDNLQKIGY